MYTRWYVLLFQLKRKIAGHWIVAYIVLNALAEVRR